MTPTHGTGRIHTLIRAQEKAQRLRLLAAAICAVLVSVGAVVLLGLSGWFLTAAAIAGLSGVIVANAFNYMIPSAMIRLLAIIRTASRYGERITSHDAALKALAALRPQLFAGLARAPVSHSLSLGSGDASARLMQDVDAIQNRFVRMSTPWGAGSAVLVGLILCAIAGWTTAILVTGLTLAGMGVAALIGKTQSAAAGRDVQTAAGALKDEMSSLVSAAPELRAYAITDLAIEKLAARAAAYDAANQRLALSGAAMMASQMLFTALAVAAVYLTAADGPPALAALAILGAVASIDAAGTLVSSIRQNGAVEAASQRLDELLGNASEHNDGEPLAAQVQIADLPILTTRHRLAIIGDSGAGKTTLIERLIHLRPVIANEAWLGGTDNAEVSPNRARALFAYAPQTAQFLTGTLAENLRLSAPRASDEDMWAALADACIDARFRSSPQGLNTPLGENGAVLSGGERRRVGLARAYLRCAPFLVLDEPTEGLDATTEAEVIARLEQRLKSNRQGLILISHRPAPMALCKRTAIVSGIAPDQRVIIHASAYQGPTEQSLTV